jgi:UDP-glucose-4-epimerase GalE
MRVIVTGGAGYLGSHICKALAQTGTEILVVDNLERGNRAALNWGNFNLCDLRDPTATTKTFESFRPEVVIHAAAYAYVGESFSKRDRYFQNNVEGTRNVLDAMTKVGCRRIIFSSSCSVYGNASGTPLTESQAIAPINPYAETKVQSEILIRQFADQGLGTYAILRFFNLAGADPDFEIGESHDPETHLIPLAIKSAFGTSPILKIFGNDYPTPDGTCIRDYVHVSDLAQAHLKSMAHLLKGGSSEVFNLGAGQGYSVRQIISKLEEILERELLYDSVERRAGDPAILIADISKAQKILEWTPVYSDLHTIVETALVWERLRMQRNFRRTDTSLQN